ncbi:hypothetical protein JVU11DRAFT_12878 [Chiua virens]|nr:hypothetical protein JVU11DRAFT_12878 [Chiua virens]
MGDLQVYTGCRKLVLAFDIGTTFSGISYCILEPGKVPEILGVTRQALRWFPAQELIRGDAKVASLLYYDKHGNFKAAGAEVFTESNIQTAMEEDWTKAEWWKLRLRPKHLASSIKDDDLPPLPCGKTTVNILADFIKYLFQCAKTYIKEHHLAFTWSSFEDSIEFVFTHPNGWEAIQQQLYRRAIEHAGLIPCTPEGRSRVHMLTDGEAVIGFCIPVLFNADITNQAGPQGVVIIDAGGGTIDLSMFSMSFNPISCAEIAPAECRLQGSVFITRRARALLQRKLEDWDHSSEDEIAELAREFDQSTKLIIKSDREPVYIRVAGRRYSNAKYGIRFGKLQLSGEDATGLFSDSIDAVISAFEQQEKHASIPITVALLVGGLSTNDWLWSRLQSYFEAKRVKIYRPDNNINKAVANGGILSHIYNETYGVASRVARATYGVVCALPVEEDDEEHARRKALWEVDPSGDRYVPGFFEAKLRKGEQVHEEMEIRESFSLIESNPKDFGIQVVRLVCHRGNGSAPKWVDQDRPAFSVFCTIHVDLSVAAKDLVERRAFSQVYYQLDYCVIVYFGDTEITAFLGWKTRRGEERSPATILFEE